MPKAMIALHEAEVIFGKGWDTWSEAEWDEFLVCVVPEQVRIPIIRKKLIDRIIAQNVSILSEEVQAEMVKAMGPGT